LKNISEFEDAHRLIDISALKVLRKMPRLSYTINPHLLIDDISINNSFAIRETDIFYTHNKYSYPLSEDNKATFHFYAVHNKKRHTITFIMYLRLINEKGDDIKNYLPIRRCIENSTIL